MQKKTVPHLASIGVVILTLFCCLKALAVPPSFLKSYAGNMHDIDWYLLEQDNIQIYYDKGAPAMGRYALSSLNAGYPYLSSLLGVDIGLKLPPFQSKIRHTLFSSFPHIVLIVGDRAEGAGFANPVTNNIETQMVHPRSAAFFQHELVHRLMYEHTDIHIGAPGRLFSLAMMPTWWIEGLAEYLTESVGKQETQGFTRQMALASSWPSWERLHSLYNAENDTNLRGYVTSGQFMKWIMSHVKEPDLSKIHAEISSSTFTPFFYTATDNWLKKYLSKNGEELYSDFKDAQKNEWNTYLNQMPSILKSSQSKALFKESKPSPVYSNLNRAFISKLAQNKSLKESTLIVHQFDDNKTKRHPLSLFGSSVFAPQKENNSLFLTTEFEEYPNGSYGNNIKIVHFKGNISDLKDTHVESQTTVPFASQKNPLVIDEIQYAGENIFFIRASLKGQSLIYSFDVSTKKLSKLKEYTFPAFPKFIKSTRPAFTNSVACVKLIVNWDHESTSLEQTCTPGTSTVLVPQGKLVLRDGFSLSDGSLRLLAAWDKLQSVVDWRAGHFTPLAAFPDWIEELSAVSSDDNHFGAWIYKKGGYEFFEFDGKKLTLNFKLWQKYINSNATFAQFPDFTRFESPFVQVYNSNKNLPPIEPKKIAPVEEKEIKKVPAPYDHHFLFAFPYALPDVLGGPSVNLVAIPYQDKMERDAVQIMAGYNFYLQAPSGTVSYINNRLFDGFVASVFAAPFFNGSYQYSNQKYYNYLLQEGVSLANLFRFRPTSFQLHQVVSLAKLEPYTQLGTAPGFVGPQETTLVSMTENLSFNLFNAGIRLSPKDSPLENYGVWSTNASLGGGKFNSINNSTNSQNKSTGNLDYTNVNAAAVSRFSFFKQSLTLSGRMSTTQGPHTFNLQEYYSPYQSYILGATDSLNYLSFPVMAKDSLFNLKMGVWSAQSTLSYEFPLKQDDEFLFLMAYMNDWHGILSVSEGGVSTQKNLSHFDKATTLSVGTTVTADIKGFQFYPSLFYSQLLEEGGWGVIFQVKMMDFM